MNHDVDVLAMVRRANPLPNLERFDPDEVAAGITAIEAAWQTDKQAPVARPLPVSSSRRRIRYAIAFIAAAVVALILIGGPILLRDRQAPPVVDEPTTTMPTTVTTAPVVTSTVAATTTTVTTTTMPLVPMPGISFTRGSEAEIPEAMIETMIQGGPGLIAVGVSMACGTVDGEFTCNGDGGIWISADAGPWEPTENPTLLGGSQEWIYDVVAGPLGIVAVGEDEGGVAAVWLSQDGIDWSRVPHSEDLGRNSKMFSVAFGGPGVVAVGTTGSLYAGVWVSDDGTAWTRVESPEFKGDSEPAVMDSLAASSGGLLAAGRVGFPEGFDQAGTERMVLWVSPDGIEWERLPDGMLEALGVRRVDSIQAGDTGFLMIASEEKYQDELGIWASPDGRTWERVAVPYMGSAAEPSSVDHIGTEWDGSRWVSVGFEQSTGQVWASFALGVPWQPVGLLDAEAFSDGFNVDGVIVTETGFVIISTYGSTYRDEEPARFNTWTGTWDE